jgi:hypothetical protein
VLIKKNGMSVVCFTCGGEEKCIQDLVGKPEGKGPLGRRRLRCEDNIKMDLQEVGLEGVRWINLAQGRDRWRVVVKAEILRLP